MPFSLPMVHELKRARDAAVEGSVYVFPGRFRGTHIAKFSADGLPAYGMMLRRTYRTLCAELGIDEISYRPVVWLIRCREIQPGTSRKSFCRRDRRCGPTKQKSAQKL